MTLVQITVEANYEIEDIQSNEHVEINLKNTNHLNAVSCISCKEFDTTEWKVMMGLVSTELG